jgi:RNA polymerase sigma-70 factor (ECF subfamily)
MGAATAVGYAAKQDASEPDALLVARAQRELPGPSPAFETLVLRHRARIERRASAILGGRAEGEDAAQDVFVSIFRALPRYEQRQPFVHWLERIVTNTCRMHLRSRNRYERRMQALADESSCGGVPCLLPDLQLPAEALRLAERISEMNRRAFVLRTAADLPYSDIAKQLGISESAAKMRVRRAHLEAARLGAELRRETQVRPPHS